MKDPHDSNAAFATDIETEQQQQQQQLRQHDEEEEANNNNNNNNTNGGGVKNEEDVDEHFLVDSDSYYYDDGDTSGDHDHNEGCFFADATLDLADAHDLVSDDHRSATSSLTNPDTDSATATATATASANQSKNNKNNKNIEMVSLSAANNTLSSSSSTATHHHHHQEKGGPGKRKRHSLVQMRQISNTNFGTLSSLSSDMKSKSHIAPKFRPKAPRHVRDPFWAIAAVAFIPFLLTLPNYLPIVASNHQSNNNSEEDSSSTTTSLHTKGWTHAALTSQAKTYTFIQPFFVAILTIVLTYFLYSTPAGGMGEDQRYSISQKIDSTVFLSSIAHFVLCLQIYIFTPNAWHYSFLPMFLFLNDFLILREQFVASNSPGGNYLGVGSSDSEREGRRGLWGALKKDSGRREFFKALVHMSLDILSRSFSTVAKKQGGRAKKQTKAMARVFMVFMGLQFIFLYFWKNALWKVLSIVTDTNNNNEDNNSNSGMLSLWKGILILEMLIVGKWGSSIISRVTGLIASGGVLCWFSNQNVLLLCQKEELERQAQLVAAAEGEGNSNNNTNNSKHGSSIHSTDTASDDYSVGYKTAGSGYDIQAAYRDTDESAYNYIQDYDDEHFLLEGKIGDDELYDDDYDDDVLLNERESDHSPYYARQHNNKKSTGPGGPLAGGMTNTRNAYAGMTSSETDWTSKVTINSFLGSALTTSLGSVSKCALLGGVAQLVWFWLRNLGDLRSAVPCMSRLRNLLNGYYTNNSIIGSNSSRRRGSYSHMQISTGVGSGNGNSSSNNNNRSASLISIIGSFLMNLESRMDRLQVWARDFVRRNSDFAMSHVAGYYKSYQKAAMDVSTLIETSGVEPIIHDDITSTMCSCLASAISGCTSIIFFFSLLRHRDSSSSSKSSSSSNNINVVSDSNICEIMIVSYYMCYVLLFAMMEPMRASIKAIYVSFASFPQTLNHTYPLVYHRLTRISRDNGVV